MQTTSSLTVPPPLHSNLQSLLGITNKSLDTYVCFYVFFQALFPRITLKCDRIIGITVGLLVLMPKNYFPINMKVILYLLLIFFVFYSILRHFTAFSVILRHFAAFYCILRHFAVFCGILRHFAAFCGILRHCLAFCGILWHFLYLLLNFRRICRPSLGKFSRRLFLIRQMWRWSSTF